MANFFEGLKIVELSSVLAGPAVGMFFAELGAEVIKIENLNTGGDVTRQWRLAGETSDGPSAYFSSVNYNKAYLQLNLNQPSDITTLLDLCYAADMIISNYSKASANKFKLNYKNLKAKNPNLIYLQLDGFAESNRPAYDVVLQAETGWISMTGTPDALAKMPVALIDVMAGHQLKEAALLAILKRERTGKGSFIQCDLERASLSALANQASNYLMQKAVARPIGTLHPNIAPYGEVFVTRDGVKIVLAIGSEKQFSTFWVILFDNEPIDVLFETTAKG